MFVTSGPGNNFSGFLAWQMSHQLRR